MVGGKMVFLAGCTRPTPQEFQKVIHGVARRIRQGKV